MSARRAAQAAARKSRETAHEVNTRPLYAPVRSADPLEVEVEGTSLTLDDDDLTLCDVVVRYIADTGLTESDALVVTEMQNGDWLAHAVVPGYDE